MGPSTKREPSNEERVARITGWFTLAGIALTAALGALLASSQRDGAPSNGTGSASGETVSTTGTSAGSGTIPFAGTGADADPTLAATSNATGEASRAKGGDLPRPLTLDVRGPGEIMLCDRFPITARPLRDQSTRTYTSVEIGLPDGSIARMPEQPTVELSKTCRIVAAAPQPYGSEIWGVRLKIIER